MKVLHNSCNTDTSALPDMSTLSPWASRALGVYIRQSTCACVTTIKCEYIRMYVCTYVAMYIHTYVCIYACMYVHMYICMYVRVYVCM